MIIGDVYIDTIKSVCGGNTINNLEQAEAFNRDSSFVEDKVGPIQIPQRTSDQTTCSLGLAAAEAAISESSLKIEEVDILIVVTQNPDYGGLPHNSAILHGLLNLKPSTMCFDVGLGCSGYIHALAIAASIMKSGSYRNSLIVTSDQYRPFLKKDDPSTNLLFGDWAAATILTSTGIHELKCASFGTDGKNFSSLVRGDDGIKMNGREVFNFARKVVPTSIKEFCHENDIKLSDIDLFLLHQGSKVVVETVAKSLELSLARVPVDLTDIGNAVSSSIPILFEKYMNQGNYKKVLMSGFGVGLSWGNLLIETSE